MTIRNRMNRLERWANPEERTVYHVHMPEPGESEEERQRHIAELRAEGGIVYEVRLPSPRDEPCD